MFAYEHRVSVANRMTASRPFSEILSGGLESPRGNITWSAAGGCARDERGGGGQQPAASEVLGARAHGAPPVRVSRAWGKSGEVGRTIRAGRRPCQRQGHRPWGKGVA